MMRLLDNLRSKDKKGLFEARFTGESYATGFIPFDYRNGYVMNCHDADGNVIQQQHMVGVPGGCFATIVGKSGTAKTTFAVQMAVNMIKNFNEGLIIHCDLEQATTYTRVMNVTGSSASWLKEHYILQQGKSYIEDIFEMVMNIVAEKESMKDTLIYDTGKLDEFGDPMKIYQPTIILLDSLPSLATKESDEGKKATEMYGSMGGGRMAKVLSQFYTRLMPVLKPYNITIIAINHIKAKIEINPMMKSQPQLMYLKMDESLPGGIAPVYYAHMLVKFISSTKYTVEENGFDGNEVKATLLKSRTNKSGQTVTLVYNQLTGFSPEFSLYKFAEENNLIEGRNPYLRMVGSEIKFNRKKFDVEFLTNEAFRNDVLKACAPALDAMLSRGITNDNGESEVHTNNIIDIADFLKDIPGDDDDSKTV